VDLEATIAVQVAVIVELRAVNAAQAQAIAALEARVAELERRLGKDSSNSSKPPSSDGLGKSTRARQGGGEQAKSRRAPGKQPGAPGAHLAQVPEPDEVIWHVPDRCQGCGAELADGVVVGAEARQVFDVPPLRLSVSEHRAERRQCVCGITTQAAFPAEARAAACYGPGVRALCCYLLVHQHLPVDRAAQLLADVLGTPVSTGTMAAVLAEGAAGLEGFGQVVREQLAAAEVAHLDETGARVAGRLQWVHSASTRLLSLFTVHAKRGKVAMDAAGVLPGLHGVAVHDGWSPYWRYQVTHALCGAHLLRELDAIAEEPGQGWAAGMAELLADAKTAADRARAAGAEQVDRGCASGCTPATSGCWPTGRPPTRHHGHDQASASAVACAAARPPTCWGGWTRTRSRCCASSTTCACLSITTRPSGIFAWSNCNRRSLAAGAPWTARRRS
jgi:transposase/uncharacterized coiled-coil protein SlyX